MLIILELMHKVMNLMLIIFAAMLDCHIDYAKTLKTFYKGTEY